MNHKMFYSHADTLAVRWVYNIAPEACERKSMLTLFIVLVLLKNYWLYTVVMTIKICCSFPNLPIHCYLLKYKLFIKQVQISPCSLGSCMGSRAHIFCVPAVWGHPELILVLLLDWKFVIDILTLTMNLISWQRQTIPNSMERIHVGVCYAWSNYLVTKFNVP